MKEEQLALDTLKALGAKDTSSPSQTKRGTTCFTLPTGDCISEHKTGYIRKYLMSSLSKYKYHTCYQLNPQYLTDFKYIGRDGVLRSWKRNNRMLIHSRTESCLLYTSPSPRD